MKYNNFNISTNVLILQVYTSICEEETKRYYEKLFL